MTWYSELVSLRSGAHGAGWIGVLLAALTSLMHARVAVGATNRLASYSVPEECPARAAWLAAVRERLPPLLRTHPLLETLSVRVEKLGDGYVGELASTAEAALNSARSLRGASCEEVLDALSFVGALGLERFTSGQGGEPPSGATLASSLSPVSPAGPLSPVEVDEPRVPAQLGDTPSVQLGAGGFALLQGGLTPAQSVAFGVALRFAWPTPGWQPWVMLGAYSSLPEEHRLADGGSVRFEHWSTHAVGCPWRFPEGGRLGVRPCLELDVGRSTGEGRGVPRAAKRAAPWLSGGAQLRAELALGDRFELGASFGAVAPLWHAHFFFLPDSRSFETPDLGFRAGSYASVLF